MVKDEKILCVYRDKLDTSKINKSFEVVDIADRDNVLIPEPGVHPIIDNRFVTVERSVAENNEKYIQIVVGLILKCRDKYVFMKCINGIMNNHTTLIQGHVNFEKSKCASLLISLRLEIIRELFEELSIENIIDPRNKYDYLASELKPMYVNYNLKDKNRPSYYHYGFIYKLDLPYVLYNSVNESNLISNELSKNIAIVVTKDQLSNLENPDSWLSEMITKQNF